MATYTSSLKLLLPVDGDLSWGSAVNNNVTSLVDIAVAGYIDVAWLLPGSDQALSDGNGAGTPTYNESRYAFINMTGAISAARNVIVPTVSKLYYIKNSTTGGFAITVKTSAGTGISVPNGTVKTLMCDGTNVIEATPSTVGTSTTTQVIYNSSGAAVGSANLIFDGTSLTVNGVKVGRGLYSVVSNTAVGNGALAATTTASQSTAVGNNALAALTQGLTNTAIGYNAAKKVTIGGANVAIGGDALPNVTTGEYNVAVGNNSGTAVVLGGANTFIGYGTGSSANTTSTVAVGYQAGTGIEGTGGTSIGAESGKFGGPFTGTNITTIGYLAAPSGAGAANEITLGNSSVLTLRYYGTLTSVSDARDKTNIQPLVPGLDFINRLNPVSFDWNMRDGGKVGIADTGFLAQDLQSCQTSTEFIPGLVFTGNPDRLEAAYGKLLPVMVKAIQELTARIAVLEAR